MATTLQWFRPQNRQPCSSSWHSIGYVPWLQMQTRACSFTGHWGLCLGSTTPPELHSSHSSTLGSTAANPDCGSGHAAFRGRTQPNKPPNTEKSLTISKLTPIMLPGEKAHAEEPLDPPCKAVLIHRSDKRERKAQGSARADQTMGHPCSSRMPQPAHPHSLETAKPQLPQPCEGASTHSVLDKPC